jgi:type II secretory pathway component PulJ
MGFTTIIDILGAMFIGGILLLTLFRIQDNTISNFFYYNQDLVLQSNLLDIIEAVEGDLRRIGYCSNPDNFPDPTKAVLAADSTSIRFLSDADLDGDMDTIYLTYGSVSELSSTNNPRDRILYRYVNGSATSTSGIGVITEFKLRYFGALGNQLTYPITALASIVTMQVSILVENPDAYDQNYSTAYWRQVRLASRNLTAR